jgi:hypothetical protein
MLLSFNFFNHLKNYFFTKTHIEMRKTASILLGLAVLLFIGCATADQKIPEMATDFCNCFTEMDRNMSSQTKDIMQKAANATDPETTMKSELEKLNDEDQAKVKEEMMTFGEMEDKNSKVGKCMADVETKYGSAKTFNEKKFLEKLIKELESKTGCNFTATLMKIGMRVKEKEGK